MGHLRVAADLLGCDRVEVANLFSIATRDVSGINQIGRLGDGWDAARPRLQRVVASSDHLLAAWGVSGLGGVAAQHQRTQVEYVIAHARKMGKENIWTLNGEPRHPSRWHQYVSDKHGRASGESFTERLAIVLMSVPLENLWSDRRHVQGSPSPSTLASYLRFQPPSRTS